MVSQRRQLRQILELNQGEVSAAMIPKQMEKYGEVFTDPEGVRRNSRVVHKITLKEGSKCHRRAAYRMAPQERKCCEGN